jgi:hypothetical protein
MMSRPTQHRRQRLEQESNPAIFVSLQLQTLLLKEPWRHNAHSYENADVCLQEYTVSLSSGSQSEQQ